MNIIDKNKYTFPFDTCEKPTNKFFAQPYSVTINMISTLIVLYFLFKTHTLHGFMLLFSLLLFDLSHTFSHFIHVKPGIQITLVHVLAYFLNFAFFYALYKYTKKVPSTPLIIFLVIILIIDIYAFFNLSLLYYILTQILFFFSIFIYYYSSLPNKMKKRLNILLVIIGIIYLGFVNEAFNCKRMLEKFPNFPFHALIEILILFAVYFFSLSFYNI
jgi:hypothetical protein